MTDIAEKLLRIEAVKLSPREPFTWASGLLSPIYCDNRLALSYPAVRTAIKHALAAASSQFGEFEVIAGVATAGIPHGAMLADFLEKPFIYVRASAKEHGRRNQIEGLLIPGQRVLVIEDLISTGGSSLQAVEALRSSGAEVAGVLAIFQYGFDAASAAFAASDVPFAALTDYPTLVEAAIRTGYISAADEATLRQWRANPQGWGALYA
jgi:orotate phosphoribosyltransferase